MSKANFKITIHSGNYATISTIITNQEYTCGALILSQNKTWELDPLWPEATTPEVKLAQQSALEHMQLMSQLAQLR